MDLLTGYELGIAARLTIVTVPSGYPACAATSVV